MTEEDSNTVRQAEDAQQRQLTRDLAVAQRIQLCLLPEFCPVVPGWEFCTAYHAARQVSGDFYDFLEFEDAPDQLGLVIADVADKGVPAALFGAMSRATIRATALDGCSPAEALRRANELLLQINRADVFVTAFYAVLSISTGTMIYANAGHNRPIWVQRGDAACCELAAEGTVMALFEDIQLEERVIDIAPGDKVVFYTDGVTDAMNADGEQFGQARLHAVINACSGANATDLENAIVKAVTVFRGSTHLSDDLTLFVIERMAGLSAENSLPGCCNTSLE